MFATYFGALVIFLAGVGVGISFYKRHRLNQEYKVVRHIQEVNEKRKAISKQKILDYAIKKGEIKNMDLVKFLGHSKSGATGYLRELVSDGKLLQVGIMGRYVSYKPIENIGDQKVSF